MRIILGSASPRRKKLLSDWGYKFDIMASEIDEQAIRDLDLRKLPLKIALAKANSLNGQIAEPAILITCDTIVVYKEQLYEKPKNESHARDMLKSYGTAPVEVISGVVVINTSNNKTAQGTETARVYFHKIPDRLIEEMIAHGKIFDFAGAFHPDENSIRPYIVHIEGETEAVMGLPKTLTEKLIEQVR